ncbi:unnamed protein product [Gongylonema pulchrum]|uniref:ZP domain-containing protein n=1 Tax=Gongylonema pulchrum TaxID=637853 RepID=A0A3P6QXK2_9BILA|nr:unnamed protein product [Gongylonema pulchrum]
MDTIPSVTVGEEIEHFWVCRNMNADQFMYVHDCTVNPEFNTGNDPVIVDSHGCTTDSLAMGPIQYSRDGHRASAKHFAYKFAGHPNLLFKCSISICRKSVVACRYGDNTPMLKVSCWKNEKLETDKE